jgi:crotonobetaine/carnitine-CoA ligase
MPTPLAVIRGYPPHDHGIWGLLESRVAIRGDATFIEFRDRHRGWRSFRDAAQAMAAGLCGAGIRPGDRVALMAGNSDRFLVLFFALARIGAVLVTVNPRFAVDEARYVLAHCEPSLVLGDRDSLSVLRAACKAGGIDAPLRSLDDEPGQGGPGADAALPPVPGPEATCVIMYTSGTTGFPKGVMHTQRSFVLAGEGFVQRMHLVPQDRMLCILPLFHLNALFYSVGGAVAAGATLVLAPGFSATGFWDTVAEDDITQVNIIAAIGSILARRPESEFRPGHGLRKVYGAPVSPELARVFHERFGVETIIEGYGMTEIPGAASMPFEGPHRYGSMGVAARHPDPGMRFTRIKVVDDLGDEVADGEIGELLVHTPIVMQGYFRDEEATAAALVDGWFRTGDRGRRDADGTLWFMGRQKDIIRRRGENISGAELDRVIESMPGVSEAAAIAVPSELGEDEILVAVVREDGADIGEADVVHWCAGRLSSIKLPRFVVMTDSLPHTATHRVAKFLIREDAALLARAVDLDPGAC